MVAAAGSFRGPSRSGSAASSLAGSVHWLRESGDVVCTVKPQTETHTAVGGKPERTSLLLAAGS